MAGFLITARAMSKIKVLQATEPANYANPGLAWMGDRADGTYRLAFVFFGDAAVEFVRPEMILRSEDPVMIYDGSRDHVAHLKLDWDGRYFGLIERGEHDVEDVEPVPWAPETPPEVRVGDPDNDNARQG